MPIQQTNGFSGKTVLITGGTTGIGRETAIQLANLGARVLITGSNEQHLSETLADYQPSGNVGSLNGVTADLSTEDGVNKLFEEAGKQFGDKLDILINNAALAFNSLKEGNYADWKRVVDTNLLSYLACCRFATDRMTAAGKGHIVLVGSMSADVREEDGSVYVATKAGIQGFAESFRKEVNEQGIKVTLIEPGAVDTDMQKQDPDEKQEATKDGSMLAAVDIANAIIYALSQPDRCDVVELKVRPHLQRI